MADSTGAAAAGVQGEEDLISRMWNEMVRAHHEVMGALPINPASLQEAWEGPGVLEGISSFIKAVDWQEPFFTYLLTFHIVVFVTAIALSWGSSTRTALIMVWLLVMVLLAPYINQVAPDFRPYLFNDQRVNYFDDKGMFISAVFTAPLLVLAVLLQLKLFYSVVVMMVKVKKLKIKASAIKPAITHAKNGSAVAATVPAKRRKATGKREA